MKTLTPSPVDSHIELQYVANTAFSSRMIEWFGGGGFSHVDIVLPNGMLLGARSDAMTIDGIYIPAGVEPRPANYERWRRVTRIRIPCTFAERNRGLKWAEDQIGKSYDKTAIWGFATGRDWREEDSWFCSELVTKFEEVVFDFEIPLLPSKVTPGTSAGISAALARVKSNRP